MSIPLESHRYFFYLIFDPKNMKLMQNQTVIYYSLGSQQGCRVLNSNTLEE